ncbi:MAG: N-acetylmuramoyl-L-alanine amidase-like domain-containing protein, partial [Candidatus Sericytochromatia bacterium]|nr:N-acetylmuramoyl-L-alanine amidase-like domain-containing protein [Candidatus Sericytochromatia bacterium]
MKAKSTWVLVAALGTGGSLDSRDQDILGQRAAAAGTPRGHDPGVWLAQVAKTFLGTPYVRGRLEVGEGPERLVCDLQALDCVTFVESSLALATCLWHDPDRVAQGFPVELARWRYRDGLPKGWASRLHYASSWAAVHIGRGRLVERTLELGGAPEARRIDFMSAHPELYAALAEPANLEAILREEERLSAVSWPCLPLMPRARRQEGLLEGDVVLVLSSRPGLDVSHMG